MIHYTCDRCRTPIDPTEDLRYVIRIQVQCVDDGSLDVTSDGDLDPLSELHHTLENQEPERLPAADMSAADATDDKLAQYDLCGHCYQRFIRNPLGRDTKPAFQFSNN